MVLQTVLMDMEFNKIIDDLMDNSVVNTSTIKEHVSDIEITIYIVNERDQHLSSTSTSLSSPISYIFSPMNEYLPSKNGIPEKLPPREIVVRTNLNRKNTANL